MSLDTVCKKQLAPMKEVSFRKSLRKKNFIKPSKGKLQKFLHPTICSLLKHYTTKQTLKRFIKVCTFHTAKNSTVMCGAIAKNFKQFYCDFVRLALFAWLAHLKLQSITIATTCATIKRYIRVWQRYQTTDNMVILLSFSFNDWISLTILRNSPKC